YTEMAESSLVESPELKIYHGNCHCGAIKFAVKTPETPTVGECNCSICFKKGYKHIFPGPEAFNLIRGEELLKDYEFAGKTMLHRFCPTSGTPVMGKRSSAPPGSDISINARTLNDLDIWSLPTQTLDGKSLEPSYKPAPFTGPEPTAKIEDSKIYTGGCHCGNVTMALKTTDPQIPQVSISTQDPSQVKAYIFGRSFQEHTFCGICGVSLVGEGVAG
ncbi:Centromere protein V, partial [Lachnellula subtilissima]